MRLAPVPGVTPVGSNTAEDLLAVLRRLKGTLDPGLEVSAQQAADLAARGGATLLAVVEHPDADPALLVAKVVDGHVDPHEPGLHLDGPHVAEVTKGQTATGYPVLVVERIPPTGAQLQVVVSDPEHHRMAVFTLHSPSGRGWLDVAGVAGRFVSGVEFTDPGSRSVSRRPTGGTPGRSGRR
ncbi:hypothetical protein [Actinosynnema sp. NPDC020468]|uniref:hypothetical protein n=1 Tax=Actinosynnema sp. NPDC020468 TaxID=3154488 RepID=UPI0033C451FD